MLLRTGILALIVSLAAAPAHAGDAQDSVSTGSQPVMVKVATVRIVDEAEQANSNATFAIVNETGPTACYAVAVPVSATVDAGDTYAVVPKTDLDEAMRTKVAADYPNCHVVDVVARVAR